MANSEQLSRGQFELEDVDDAEEVGRCVKCRLEEKMEANSDSIVTVEIDVKEVAHRERY